MNTGGPAFPQTYVDKEYNPYTIDTTGMTLRDYFAGQVAIGAMSQYCWNGDRFNDPTPEDIAQEAYRIADAMLKARGNT